MRIYHNSQDRKFRYPQGAVETGKRVRLSVMIESEVMPEVVKIRLWDTKESYVTMEAERTEGANFWYTAEIDMPKEPGLVWYYFEAQIDGRRLYYSNNPRQLGGVGVMGNRPSDKSYQITVYDKNFKTPNWFKNSIIYQIFPDRFFREGEADSFPQKTGEYRIHKDWYEGYFYDSHPFEDGPALNDFYGGNLKGIISKLGYLKELGVNAVYLNPIFEAFSNHRYDTGDYSKIDPILGDEKDFTELCLKAESLGIKIILDGVFSHTGSDSVYFNKYGNYGESTGASRDKNSPYAKWFQLNDDGSYSSWWGCSNLINVVETEPTYIDYILRGRDAIIKKWLMLGAWGWRLDVADELPGEFIKILRKEVKSQNKDAVIIGEVWEDASNKMSYGEKREYLFGYELDGVMNYPFRDGVLGFLLGEKSAQDFAAEQCSIMENYPKEALYSGMNLIGSHDTCRAKTVLSGQSDDSSMSMEERYHFRVEGEAETLAIKRLRLAAFLQMTFVGVPCIYYGDEIGMQGLKDPFNRRPFSWRRIDPELLDWYKKLSSLRNSLDCLRTGDFEFLYKEDGAIAYKREIKNGKDVFGFDHNSGVAICCVNRNDFPCEFKLDLGENTHSVFKGIIGGKTAVKKGEVLEVVLGPYGAEVFVGGEATKSGKQNE